MKKFATLFGFLFLAAISFPIAFAQVLSEELQQEMIQSSGDELININIIMVEQYDVQTLTDMTRALARKDKRRVVAAELKSHADRSQAEVLRILHSFETTAQAADIQPMWIANVISCRATPPVIEYLSNRSDIHFIYQNLYQIMIDPIENEHKTGPEGITEITYNILQMNAQEVWDLGYEGEDVVVAVLDTGVNYNHNDIKNNMWEHPDFPYHGWNFVNNTNDPMDDHIFGGHGTHVAGTVAGDGTSGSQTGVAPKAKIMAMKVLNSFGGGSESNVWNALQFCIDNEADVLNLSLGWLHANNPNRTVWRNTFDNVLAAGIIASVAAGNEGEQLGQYPVPDNVRTPGDVPPPWLHPDQTLTGGISSVVSVGATNINNQVVSFSSRGPVTWQNVSGYNDYAYNPGMGLIRPDVVAPGDDIKSLSRTNNSGYNTMSGTSMAAPGVAGVMALMLSKNPDLTPAQISQILEETTFVLETGKNSTSGSGRVDALAAVNAVPTSGVVYHAHQIDDSEGNNNGSVNPGEYIYLTIEVVNEGSSAVENVAAALSSPSEYIQIIAAHSHYGDLAPGQIVGVTNGFSFEVSDIIPDGYMIQFILICSSGDFSWESEFFIHAESPDLEPRSMALNDHNGNLDGIPDAGETADIFVNTFNSGQFEAVNATAVLSTEYPHAVITSNEFHFDHIAAADSAEAFFTVWILDDAQPGDQILFNYTLDYGSFSVEKEYIVHVSAIVDDFETNDFSRFNWSTRGHELWQIIVCGVIPPIDGNYAARSGVITHNQRSELTLNYYAAQDDSIGFYYWVYSEEGGDFLKFYIDNVLQDQWSGETGWQWVSFPVNAGNRIFKWEYIKNAEISAGNDIALIDYVKLPPGSFPRVYAGENAEICANEVFSTNAVAENFTQLSWTSSGDGSFTSPHNLVSDYIPGPQDLQNQEVTLTLKAHGTNNILHHSLDLTLVPEPVVMAGNDVSICSGDVLMLEDAYAENHAQLIWSGNGSGTFDDPHAIQTFYTPSEQDIENGSVVITLTATGMATCEDAESSFTLTIHALPTAMLSGDVDICHGEQAQLSIVLTGTPPWEVLTSMDEQPLVINASPYQFSVSPDVSTVYSLISVSDANMCSNNADGQASVNVGFIPEKPEMPSGSGDVDYAYTTASVYTIEEVENATAYMWGIQPANAGSLTASGTEATVSWADNFQGEVDIFVLAQNDCGDSDVSDIKKVTLINTIGIASKDGRISLNLYPNPSTGLFTMKVGSPYAIEIDLNIVNLLGQVVYTQNNISVKGQLSFSIDPGNLDVGIYMVSIISPHGIANKKLIISR
jgi:subtilisin family serine protease